MDQPAHEPLWSTQDLADFCGVPLSTVFRWNHEGTGPTRISLGKRVKYRPADVVRWIESRAHAPAGR